MNYLLLSLLLLISIFTQASENYISSAEVTNIRTYELESGRYHVMFTLDNIQYGGINPNDGSTACEFWTNSKSSYKSLLVALKSDRSIKLSYMARGDAADSCRVKWLTLSNTTL